MLIYLPLSISTILYRLPKIWVLLVVLCWGSGLSMVLYLSVKDIFVSLIIA